MSRRRKDDFRVMISVVAERYDVHPQTLRLYEREGLINPDRSGGNTRLFDERTLRRLESILALTRDMGVNLAGVEVILKLQDELDQVREEHERLRTVLESLLDDRATTVRRSHALVRIQSGPLVPRRKRE